MPQNTEDESRQTANTSKQPSKLGWKGTALNVVLQIGILGSIADMWTGKVTGQSAHNRSVDMASGIKDALTPDQPSAEKFRGNISNIFSKLRLNTGNKALIDPEGFETYSFSSEGNDFTLINNPNSPILTIENSLGTSIYKATEDSIWKTTVRKKTTMTQPLKIRNQNQDNDPIPEPKKIDGDELAKVITALNNGFNDFSTRPKTIETSSTHVIPAETDTTPLVPTVVNNNTEQTPDPSSTPAPKEEIPNVPPNVTPTNSPEVPKQTPYEEIPFPTPVKHKHQLPMDTPPDPDYVKTDSDSDQG